MAASLLKIYKTLSKLPKGNWLFSKAVCRKAPYFSSIKPHIIELDVGVCRAQMPKRKAVLNHIGTVHAIAQCNLAELCAGLVTDASIPSKTHRWIPKGMTVEYLKKAGTDLHAIAEIPLTQNWVHQSHLTVPVHVYDDNQQAVFYAEVTMYITEKPST